MAKSPKSAAATFRPVSEIIADVLAIEAKGEANVLVAQAEILAGIIAAIRGKVAPVSAEAFEAAWRAPLKAAMLDAKNGKGEARYTSAGAISVALTNHKNVILALSHVPANCNEHKLLPTANETNFDLFAKAVRHRLALPQFKILEEVKERDPKPSSKDQVKALQDQVKATEAKLAAATAKVTDNASAQAAQQTTATTVNAALAAAPPVDVLCGALNAMCPNHKVSRSDAEMILQALRKDFDGALSMLRFVAAKEPAKA